MKIDLHVCTTHSKHPDENPASPKEAVSIAVKRGLDGIVIADHDTCEGAKEARKYAPKGFLVIVGNEISTRDGHIVLLGVEEDIQPNLSLGETLDIARSHDGVVILPHPNIPSLETSICEPTITKYKDQIDACHLYSARHLRFYRVFKKVVDTHGFPPVGCSYAHEGNEIGTIYTEFDHLDSEADFLDALKKGEIGKISFLNSPTGIQNIAKANLKVFQKFLYWRRYFLKERVPVYYKDILRAIDEQEDFTQDDIKSYLIEAESIPDVERDMISLLTIQETLKYLEKKGMIKGNGRLHLNRDISDSVPNDINKALFYRISLRYFANLVFR